MMNYFRSFFAPKKEGDGDEPPPLLCKMGTTCPRAETVRELAEILKRERVVHIRGTPASGKSYMAHLLRDYLESQTPTVPVILFSSWPQRSIAISAEHFLTDRAKAMGLSFEVWKLLEQDIVFILDEGQQSYDDDELWALIKFQDSRTVGPQFCILSSYGSPSTGPERMPATSPVYLNVRKRVSIKPSLIEDSPRIALFYDEIELEDVVRRFSDAPQNYLRISSGTRRFLLDLTQGQPGAVDAMLRMLEKEYHHALKHEQLNIIEPEHVLECLGDEQKAFRHLLIEPVKRSFVDKKVVTNEAAGILRQVLFAGRIEKDLDRPGVRQCYMEGWLHSEALDYLGSDVVLVFPTPLHAKYVECFLTDIVNPFPTALYPTLPALAEAMLRRFSMRNLVSTGRIGPAAAPRPVEAAYQDEAYRALHALLGFSAHITSEWSKSGSHGRIDFRIGGVGWGLELVREGQRLAEHCERFRQNGRYWNWVQDGSLADWLVIDCRTSTPQLLDPGNTKLWRAIFAQDMSSVEILDAVNDVIVPRFPLLSQ